MKIDNANVASQVRMAYIFIPAFIVLLVASIYLIGLSSSIIWVIIGLGLLLIYVSVVLIYNHHYILIFVGPDIVMIRYKALWPPTRTANNSIEIKPEDFAGYKITEGRFRTNLVVYKQTPGGKAKYSEVCINLLNKEQIEKLKRSFALLTTISKKNK